MYKLLVFDLDGTLLDTLDDITDSVNFVLEKYSFPKRTREEVRSFVGNGIANLIKRACACEEVDEIVPIFKEHYASHCAIKTKPFEGVLETVRMLREKGYILAVLSNKAEFATKKLVAHYFGDIFHEAVGENEAIGRKRKPDPNALFSIMEQFGVATTETAYIGDSEVDIQTAKNAGVDCICMTWGFRDEADLLRAGGTKIAHGVTQLKEFCVKE